MGGASRVEGTMWLGMGGRGEGESRCGRDWSVGREKWRHCGERGRRDVAGLLRGCDVVLERFRRGSTSEIGEIDDENLEEGIEVNSKICEERERELVSQMLFVTSSHQSAHLE